MALTSDSSHHRQDSLALLPWRNPKNPLRAFRPRRSASSKFLLPKDSPFTSRFSSTPSPKPSRYGTDYFDFPLSFIPSSIQAFESFIYVAFETRGQKCNFDAILTNGSEQGLGERNYEKLIKSGRVAQIRVMIIGFKD